MAVPAIACGACASPVPAESWNNSIGIRCLGCGGVVEVTAFPAIARTVKGAAPEAVDSETEASCFFHPESRAAAPCDQCGRFLCHLCEIQIDGRVLCPTCFSANVSSNQIETVITSRTMYDTMTLAVSTFPALLFWPVLLSAPATLVMVFRYWNKPGSILPRTRVRFVLAALFAVAEIVGIGLGIWAITQVPRVGAR